MAIATIKELKTELKYGKEIHSAVLSDGVTGYYDIKKFPTLSQGLEVGYTSTTTPKGLVTLEFNEFKLIADKEQKPPVYLDIARKEEIRREKYISNNKAAELTIEAFGNDKITEASIPYFVKMVRTILFDGIDEISKD